MDKVTKISLNELRDNCLDSFDRHQEVKKCWRKVDGDWALVDIIFTENWDTPTKKHAIIRELRNTTKNGGAVFAYVHGGQLLAFGSMSGEFFGRTAKYLQLELLHVSRELRGKGFGSALFNCCIDFAREKTAEKVYISGHSCEETQGFYKAMGCVPTTEVNSELFYREPFDVHLEFIL